MATAGPGKSGQTMSLINKQKQENILLKCTNKKIEKEQKRNRDADQNQFLTDFMESLD